MNNSGIQKLQLSSSAFGDEVSLVLALKWYHQDWDMFHHMHASVDEEPNLSFSFLIMQGAKAIAEMLKKNSTLRVIELNNNLIDYSV